MQVNREALAERGRDLLGVGRLRSGGEHRRDEILLGICAAVVVVIVAAALGLVYLRPLGYSQYRAEMSNASGVRVGDQVRIAGIMVGEVKSVKIERDRVGLAFSVKSQYRVGNDSALAVKMLTPVGGRYVMLSSRGGSLLGDRTIPRDRVTGTYDLTTIIEKTTPKIEQLDGTKLRSVIASASKTLGGDSGAIGGILDAAGSLADGLGERSEQLQVLLRVSDEYLAATTKDRDILMTLMKSLGEIGVGLGTRYDQVYRTFNLLKRFFGLLDRLLTFYAVGFEKFVDEGAKVLAQLKPHVDAIAGSLKQVDATLEQLRKAITPNGITVDQSAQTVQGGTVCVPNSVRKC